MDYASGLSSAYGDNRPCQAPKGCVCCTTRTGACCPCCYQRFTFLLLGGGGCGGCCLFTILFIVGVAVKGADWLAILSLFFMLPLAVVVGVAGCLCYCWCAPAQEESGPRDVDVEMGRPCPAQAEAVEQIPQAEAVVDVPDLGKGWVQSAAAIQGSVEPLQGSVVQGSEIRGTAAIHGGVEPLQGSVVPGSEIRGRVVEVVDESGFDAEGLLAKLGRFGDKKQIVADHCRERKGRAPTAADLARLFAPLTMSFDAKDVARGLVQNAHVGVDAAVAGVNAATFVARVEVARIFAAGLSDGDKAALASHFSADFDLL